MSKERFVELDRDNRIWWGKDGNSIPQIKRFLTEVKQGVVPQTMWFYNEVGHTQDAKKELVQIMDFADSESVFITPKPTRLIERILQIASNPGDLVLDSFAGSGTTGHAALKLNHAASEQAPRRFILVEIEAGIARDITAKRVRRAIQGHTNAKGENTASLGGGFRYSTLGQPLFARQAMGIGAGDPELHRAEGRAVVGSERPMGLVDEAADLGRGDPRSQDASSTAVDLQGHGLGLGHQSQFGQRLDRPATVHHRGAVQQGEVRRGLAQTIKDEEGQGGVDGQRPGAEAGDATGRADGGEPLAGGSRSL